MEEQMENIFTDEARAAEHLASGVHSELYEHAYAVGELEEFDYDSGHIVRDDESWSRVVGGATQGGYPEGNMAQQIYHPPNRSYIDESRWSRYQPMNQQQFDMHLPSGTNMLSSGSNPSTQYANNGLSPIREANHHRAAGHRPMWGAVARHVRTGGSIASVTAESNNSQSLVHSPNDSDELEGSSIVAGAAAVKRDEMLGSDDSMDIDVPDGDNAGQEFDEEEDEEDQLEQEAAGPGGEQFAFDDSSSEEENDADPAGDIDMASLSPISTPLNPAAASAPIKHERNLARKVEVTCGPAKHQVKEFNILPNNTLCINYEPKNSDYILIRLLCDKKMRRREKVIFMSAVSAKHAANEDGQIVLHNLKISKEMLQGRTKGFKFCLAYTLVVDGKEVETIKSNTFYIWSNVNQPGFPRKQREQYLAQRIKANKRRRKP